MYIRISPRALRSSYLAFRLTLGAVVLLSSFPVAAAAAGTGRWHLAAMAGLEAIGAVLFLLPRTLRLGAVLLLLTFCVAIVTHALRGEYESHLVVYAVATLFVLAQGPTGPTTPAAT